MSATNKPKLFSYYRSSCSYRVRIALNFKNIDFEYVPVHLIEGGGQQHREDYAKLNPMRQIPFYYDGEWGLGQSMAIMLYLDEKHPTPRLFPQKRDERFKVIELCELINSGIQPLQNLSVLQALKQDHGFSQDDVNAWCKRWIQKGLAAYETMVEKIAGEYSVMHTLSAADMFLIPQVYNAQRYDVDMEQFPSLQRITANCLKLDCFMNAGPQNQPDTPQEN